MKNFIFAICWGLIALSASAQAVNSQQSNNNRVFEAIRIERMLNRFLSYVRIESQSIDDSDMSFPLSDGQKEIARYIYNEVKAFGGKGVKVTLSDDYYIYIDIPSNVKKDVPSILFMAHLDQTPEAPGVGINPLVHRNYDGGDIALSGGITLTPNAPEGRHLKDLKGKTIISSGGTTLLGADCKCGCAVLVTMVEEIIKNPKFKHGRVMVALSQNEDIGKAAIRYDPTVFGDKPDIVIDVDGDTPGKFSVANFSARALNFYFKGNKVHPGSAKEGRYADALTAAAFFVGQIPPSVHASQREGEEGYVHCYSFSHPIGPDGKEIDCDFVTKLRLRYFDKKEGEYQEQLIFDNLRKTQEAFPFVDIKKTLDVLQYENVAYSMPEFVPNLVMAAARDAGMEMTPKSERGGTTSAMMVARFPDAMPGGSCIYSGQQAEHSVYEWCCVEELVQLVEVTKNIVKQVATMPKLQRQNEWKAGEVLSKKEANRLGSSAFSEHHISPALFNRIYGKSYKVGARIDTAELRYLHLLHYTLKGEIRKGELICNKYISKDLTDIFKALYDAKYPIESLVLIDEFDADDERSMSANNSSCFCYRAVNNGSGKLSAHSRGLAVDINPRYNPCVRMRDGELQVEPANGIDFVDRSKTFSYKIDEMDLAYKFFTQHGFTWGGKWSTLKDYQHFEKSITPRSLPQGVE